MVKIVIPNKQHPSLNVWTNWHWSERHSEKEGWEEEIMWLGKKYNKPLYKKATIQVTYYFGTNRVRDYDNFVPKFILDGLRKADIIVDDNDSDIFINWKIKVDKSNPRTVIKVVESDE